MTEGPDAPPGLESLPAALAGPVRDAWERLRADAPAAARRLADDSVAADGLARVWAASEFVRESVLRHPEDLDALLGPLGIPSPWTRGELSPAVDAALEGLEDEAAAMRALRVFRRRQMVRAAWRDIAGLAGVEQTLGLVSELADACIRAATAWGHRRLAARHGEPRDEEGRPQSLLVLGMGKLGGGELNFSSDVDLVFLFPRGGATDGDKQIANDQFFIRLGQRIIRLLDEVTEDGFVFRVDMRLRPFGDSGPLAISLPAFEDYLQQHGRTWERYAYVKARPVTGHSRGMGLYQDILRPFVFRRYLDYGVFESLREMRQLIEVETGQASLATDIKRGPGGIREIEFIVQSFQILRGGADPALRDPSLLTVLPRLAGRRHLPEQAADDLAGSYLFLRKLENRIQQWQDRQTHALPEGDEGRLRLAWSLGFADWTSCAAELDRHRHRVHAYFHQQVMGGEEEASDLRDRLGALWAGSLDAEAAEGLLTDAGFDDPGRALDAVGRLAHAAFVGRLDKTGRRRLDQLVPSVLIEAGSGDRPELALERLAEVLGAVGPRSAYFALLNENPSALAHLAVVCRRSAFLAGQVARYPVLLDDLIDPRIFEEPPGREALARTLSERLDGLGSEDMEDWMDALRQFQRSAVFLVAVADLSGRLPLMKVSDRLTDIAEVCLEACLEMARRQMEERYGRPRCDEAGRLRDVGFAVIGYGKLGGLELGYASDLDLVFVHDSEGEVQQTDGEPPVENGLFFARMARRLVHLLSTQTSSGVLYDVDTRLRPSGKAGLLMTSLQAFETYQREEAWTWEHQALLRARAVAGDPAVRARFEEIRRRILCEAVRRDDLKEQVRNMRERMLREHTKEGGRTFDPKQDRGGISDIEFLVQYWVLADAHREPALVEYPDNIRQLEALVAAGRVPAERAAFLKEAYLAYRTRLHESAQAREPREVEAGEFAREREGVSAVWREVMEDA